MEALRIELHMLSGEKRQGWRKNVREHACRRRGHLFCGMQGRGRQQRGCTEDSGSRSLGACARRTRAQRRHARAPVPRSRREECTPIKQLYRAKALPHPPRRARFIFSIVHHAEARCCVLPVFCGRHATARSRGSLFAVGQQWRMRSQPTLHEAELCPQLLHVGASELPG